MTDLQTQTEGCYLFYLSLSNGDAPFVRARRIVVSRAVDYPCAKATGNISVVAL